MLCLSAMAKHHPTSGATPREKRRPYTRTKHKFLHKNRARVKITRDPGLWSSPPHLFLASQHSWKQVQWKTDFSCFPSFKRPNYSCLFGERKHHLQMTTLQSNFAMGKSRPIDTSQCWIQLIANHPWWELLNFVWRHRQKSILVGDGNVPVTFASPLCLLNANMDRGHPGNDCLALFFRDDRINVEGLLHHTLKGKHENVLCKAEQRRVPCGGEKIADLVLSLRLNLLPKSFERRQP